MKTMKKITYGLAAAVMTLLGLSGCASKKAVQNGDGSQNASDSLEVEKIERDPGRMMVLYGGPNMRYRERAVPEQKIEE